MADILIKNIEMPSCCGNCQFNQFHEANPWTTWETCRILDKDTDDIGEGRLADCPLVALQEHGDLIDEDEFRQVIYREIRKYKEDEPITMILKRILWEMDNAPVIVEATE